jgi:transposase InsO family protein
MKYLTRWDENASVKDCTADIMTWSIFKQIIIMFGFPKVLISDRGFHFLNNTIQELTQVFMIHHKKRTPYHPQANGMVESFNNILEHDLDKFCNVQCDEWDKHIPTFIWEYRTTCK